MIHIVQCLCGPARHAIYAVLYDDDGGATPDTAKKAMAMLIEEFIENGTIRRRCEMCDKDVAEFWYEDAVTAEQDWDKVQAEMKRKDMEQTLTRWIVQTTRKAGRN